MTNIKKIVAKNEIVLSAEDFDDELFNSDHHDTDNHYMTDVSGEACIEELLYNGFSESDIEKLFKGEYYKESNWGPIPHIIQLYTDEQRSFYILTLGVLI